MKGNIEGPDVWRRRSSPGVCVYGVGRGWGDPRWLKEGVIVISLLLRLTCQRALMGRAGSLLSKRLQTDGTLDFLAGITV